VATERGLDRLIFFTDAVAAIAITLLILPLVDLVPEASDRGTSSTEFLQENVYQILGFLISFVVIARLWRAHHAIFEHVRAYSKRLMTLSLLWAFTVVVLPLPTALVSELDDDRSSVALYIGTMMVSSFTLTAMTLAVRGDPTVESVTDPIQHQSLVGALTTSALFACALLLGVILPSGGLFALLLLVLTQPIQSVLARQHVRRENRLGRKEN
jgi:uncharacterized membrane protein